MSTVSTRPHIDVSSDGTARVGKTRYKVLHLAREHYHHGWTAEELLRQHPDLRREEVYSALAYFYDHREDMVAQMNRSQQTASENRPPQTVSRQALLNRTPTANDSHTARLLHGRSRPGSRHGRSAHDRRAGSAANAQIR
ncbi:MAG: DUF433 domain-containing protein [Planctomycetaceae bacterium]|nr:DUF433 domain-containing protein [Planctomycetaceae bacterium]